MLDPKRLLDDLLGTRVPGTQGDVRQGAGRAVQMAKDNPLATGAIAAVLLGTGTGRKLTGSAVKLGGLALVAGLAYKAYQNYQNGGQPAPSGAEPGQVRSEPELLPPPADTSFHPSQAPQGEDAFAMTLIRAMVSAARADGHIDEAERERIAGRLKLTGADAEEEAFMMAELERPVNVDELVAAAVTDAQKVELYTASRLAIDPDTRAEKGYLDMLAGRLKLPDTLVDHVESTVSEVKV